jgi:hypothetical protein
VLSQDKFLWTSSDGSEWHSIAPSNIAIENIRAAYFADVRHGWVVTTEPSAAEGNSSLAAVLHTIDGGQTWSKSVLPLFDAQIPLHGGIISIDFRDPDHGVVAVQLPSSSAFSLTSLFATADGGGTWHPFPSSPAAGSIASISQQDTIVVGGARDDEIFVTHDGGVSWSSAVLPGIQHESDLTLRLIVTSGRQKIIAVRGRLGDTSSVRFFDTADRGESWRQSPLRIPVTDGAPSSIAIGDSGYWLVAPQTICDGTGPCARTSHLLSASESRVRDITPTTPFDSAKRSMAIGRLEPVSQATGSTPIRSSSLMGFDKFGASSVTQMRNWWTQPSGFYEVGFYIGGSNYSGGKPDPTVNSSWVSQVSTLGWGLMPLWVGPQSACVVPPNPLPTKCTVQTWPSCDYNLITSNSDSQGVAEANSAAFAADGLGLHTGSIIYYDLENYGTWSLSSTSHCTASEFTDARAAVGGFVNAWVRQLHTRGYKAGVYANPSHIISDMGIPLANLPDAVWVAGASSLQSHFWIDQRIYQTSGDHVDPTLGVRIDSDQADGPVNYLVSPSTRFVINDIVTSSGMTVRGSPAGPGNGTETAGAVGTIRNGPAYGLYGGISYEWWLVEWPDKTGWSAEDFLTGVGQCSAGGIAVTSATTGVTLACSPQTLIVNKGGTGSGTVTSNPAGINCGPTCQFAFTANSLVTLTESVGSGSVFGGWSGACAGAGMSTQCTLTMSQPLTATANFTSQGSTATVPTVTTTAASNVTATSATFNATINSDGGSAILERRFDWGIYPSWTDATNLNGGSIVVSGSNFSYAASGLTPGTLYQFRAWARNSSGWATVGNGLTFTTGTAAPPVCTSFAINPSSVSPSSSANSQSVTVTGSPSGCQGGNWNATGNGSWLTVSPLNGSGSGSTTLFWSQNPSTTSRTDSATIGGRSFSVTQSGTTPPACASFTINPSSASPSSAAGSQPVTITGSPSGCQGGSWNATGNGSWLTVSPSSGIGPGATTVFWNQNSLTSSRTDSASIAGWSYLVTQSAATGSGDGGPHAFIDVPGAAVQLHDLGVAPDGSVYVLYPTSNPNALVVVKSTDGGASWGSPVAIENSNYSDLYHLAVDSSGAIHVVWGLSSGGGTETFYSRSTNGGASFSSPIQVRSGNTYNGYRTNNSVEPVVASDGSGNVYVAYGAYTKDGAGNFVGYNIWVSQSTNGGASFQPEFSINAISSAQKFPRRIRATASNFYVLYMDETNYDLYFYRRNVGAASGNTGRLNANTGSVQYDGDFVMAANEMTVYGTYSDTTGDSEGNITLCKSIDGGVTWPVCTRVNDSVNRQQHTPRVGLDGLGNLHMAWADGRANGRLQIYYAYSADGGGSFTPNVNLSSPVTQTDFSQTHVAIDRPNSAVYVSATRNYSQVVVARLPMTPAAQDTIAPVGSVIINNGTSFTTSTGVLLSMSASDAVGVVGYYVSNSSSVPSFGQSGWSSVGSTTSLFTTLNGWQIPSGDGLKTVYVWFKDAVGNVSGTASDGITLDQTPPSNGILSATPGDHQVQLSWSGQNDATTSVGSYKLVFAGGNTPPADCSGSALAILSPYTHTGLTNGQSYSYRLCTTDSAGNVSIGAVATATPQSGVGGVLHINNLLADFNGDHKADVLWRIDGSGLDAMWLMNGITKALGQYLETAPSRWIVAGVGDFDGDGKVDILWRDPVNGEDAMWLMSGPTKALGTYIESAGPQWIVAGVGDFNGDGKADILWRNPATGEDAMWLMNGPTKAVGVYIEVAGPQWVVAGVGDFNGDGKADIVWRNPANGDDAMWLMDGPTKAVGALIETAPPRWRIVGVGDFNFDGRADILWRDPANGDNAMWLMNGTTKTLGTYLEWAGTTWSVAGVGDLDGDGKADIFWRDTSGLDAIWLMNGPNKSVGAYTETAPLPWRVVP